MGHVKINYFNFIIPNHITYNKHAEREYTSP